MAAKKGNKYALGNNGGRPPFFNSAEELEKKIDEYFNNCPDERLIVVGFDTKEIPNPTLTGLAIYLGFCSRQSLYDYEEKQEYSYLIKKARLFIEREYETMLKDKGCTGAIFALKNMGWKDKSEHDHTTKGEKIESAESHVHFHSYKNKEE